MDSSPSQPQAAGGQPATHSLRGVLLFMLGVFLFACMDSSTKYLVSHYDVPLVVAIRYIGNFLLMVILLTPSHGKALVRTQRRGLVLARGACLATASLLLGLALQRMPVAETTAIVFLSPLLVVLLAGPVLGERVGMIGWVAAVAGFGGILLIAHPGGGLDPLGTVLALCAVAVTAAYQLLSRILASTEGPVPMLFYTALVGSLVFGAYLPWSWGGEPPTPLQALLFLGTGAMGGLGHYLFTAAHRHTPASVLAPMMYAQLVWAALLGWLVFGHVPEAMSILGMGIVAASGVLVALKSRKAQQAMSEPVE
ncbi:DMT family transporter [Solimonas sp. K1W22B-7]|uniref:DMT family transporter n=1 Tax=Oleomonas cavernae TaxID=2320859 RepID=A0A418WUS4_9PROT|nr:MULTISPECIES: DMT family transporter [Pseudomonadota]AXQ31345.1 DMT family transporter [Solimonas sp. K1W22B-7]RJF96428.1 DMT family transporter [Oleomonas cavernae]